MADSEAARPVCTALGMGRLRTGQEPEAGRLLDERAPTRRQCVDGLVPRSVRIIHCDSYKMSAIFRWLSQLYSHRTGTGRRATGTGRGGAS